MKKIKWKTLGEICEIERGIRIKKKDLSLTGNYPVVSGGTGYMGYLDEYNREAETITIAQYGTAGYVNWQKKKFWANDVCFSVFPKNIVLNKYLYYFLKNKQEYLYKISNKTAIPYSISKEKILKIQIPLPPLKKQAKIAAALDKFTELTAREAQYNYYRNMLLIDQWNDKNIKLKNAEIIRTTVGDIIERCSEKAKNDKNVTTVYTVSSEFGLIPSIDYWKKKGSKNKKSYKMFSDDTSNYNIVRKNMFAYNQGYLNIGSIDCLLNEEAVLVSPLYKTFKIKENIILPKYLLYFLKTSSVINKIDLMKESGARNRFDFEKWKKIEISIPAIEVQQKIVNILDSFETLVNDIKQGLPREIELRQKHYEYYREKLLTFDAE